ncbi:MAG TPA: 5'-3' exonuclease H3TH domain-containing protein, partial [Tepidisphaeraceae bacterium]|nr:5'-3' exonuclease H3TH domain-containing protein [Tepidisphaeraceae bacterium]
MAKTFYIIDGHAQIYRAYFAPFRDLTSPTGEPTRATYVFTQMLLNLVNQRKPDYLAMVIDSGDDTVFRKDIFKDYKANRTSPPDDFYPQEQRILEIVRDAGIPIFAKPGFEADDLIATMAKRLCGGGYETFLVSKDKDLRQTLNDCTKMYDVQSDEILDPKTLETKYGYSPVEAIEIQTLIGDSTDNIPGIPGVGEKTAVKLVKKYGSADAVLKHLDELTPKMRENFEKYADRLITARRLVTLKDDVEIEFDPEACKFTGLNTDSLRHYAKMLGFTSLVARLPAPTPETKKAVIAPAAPRSPLLFEGSLFGNAPQETAGETPAIDEDGYASGVGCKYNLIQTDQQFAEF